MSPHHRKSLMVGKRRAGVPQEATAKLEPTSEADFSPTTYFRLSFWTPGAFSLFL
jgi:hypothetical protein